MGEGDEPPAALVSHPAVTRNHPVAAAAARAGVSPSLVVQRHKGFAKVREEGRCRMCLRPSAVRPLSRHHLVPQAWFRARPKLAPLRHAEANIVPLCDPCHKAVEERGAHARIELRRLLGAAEVAFVLQLRGQDWLDLRYPATGGRPPAPPTLEVAPTPAPRVQLVHARDCEPGRCVSSCPVWIEHGTLGVFDSRRRSETRRI